MNITPGNQVTLVEHKSMTGTQTNEIAISYFFFILLLIGNTTTTSNVTKEICLWFVLLFVHWTTYRGVFINTVEHVKRNTVFSHNNE